MNRLDLMQRHAKVEQIFDPSIVSQAPQTLSSLDLRLKRAGYLTILSRTKAKFRYSTFTIISTVLGGTTGALHDGMIQCTIAAAVVGYISIALVVLELSIRTAKEQRKLLRELPLFLELLILLVESGLGLLTAVHEAVSTQNEKRRLSDPICFTFSQVNSRAARGIPLAQALEEVANETESRVLKHALLHLDMSTADGAAIVPSLRALADYSHTEWKLSVEARVRRLENWVVFPVVAAVLGLTIATAAVPILPVIDLADKLPRGTEVSLFNPNEQ